MNKCFYFSFGKRLLDLVLTVPVLVILSPVLVVLALMVRLKLGSPILFRQIRLGLNGRPLWLQKFQAMTDARVGAGGIFPR